MAKSKQDISIEDFRNHVAEAIWYGVFTNNDFYRELKTVGDEAFLCISILPTDIEYYLDNEYGYGTDSEREEIIGTMSEIMSLYQSEYPKETITVETKKDDSNTATHIEIRVPAFQGFKKIFGIN